MKRGLILAAAHALIVLSLTAKYSIDRERLPRQWMKAVPFDPNLPIRGRYVRLRLVEQSKPVELSRSQPIGFFIPEHVPDPSIRAAGEELWVEVSVPAKGTPRPIQLAVKKDGVLTPLHFN
jgi:hypothetical protein